MASTINHVSVSVSVVVSQKMPQGRGPSKLRWHQSMELPRFADPIIGFDSNHSYWVTNVVNRKSDARSNKTRNLIFCYGTSCFCLKRTQGECNREGIIMKDEFLW